MNFVIITMTIVCSLISLMIIGAIVYFKVSLPQFETPGVLTNWGGLIIGFYFGSFIGLLREWLTSQAKKNGGGV